MQASKLVIWEFQGKGQRQRLPEGCCWVYYSKNKSRHSKPMLSLLQKGLLTVRISIVATYRPTVTVLKDETIASKSRQTLRSIKKQATNS